MLLPLLLMGGGIPVFWKQWLLVVITFSTIVASGEAGIIFPFATSSEAQVKQLGLAVRQDRTEVSETLWGGVLGGGGVRTYNSSQLAHSFPRISRQDTSLPVWWPDLYTPAPSTNFPLPQILQYIRTSGYGLNQFET